jgi:hypothetical protein
MKLCEGEPILRQEAGRPSKSKDAYLRFFSRKHAIRYRSDAFSDRIKIAISQTIVTADGKIIYIKNPKAGCSSVAHLLYQYDNHHFYEGDIHHAPSLQVTDQWKSVVDIPEDTVSFSTVRNPERRSVSAFFNFFIEKNNPEQPEHLDRMELLGFSKKADNHYKFDVFLAYIEANFEYSVLKTDGHFRPQHINIGHGAVELSYISRLETLDADLKHISERVGVILSDLSKLSKGMSNQSSSGDFVPSATQKRQIEALYKKDYELYGY